MEKGDFLVEIHGVLLPANMTAKDFSILTEKRQKILIALLKEELTLSRLLEKGIDMSQSSVSDALEILMNKEFVKKDTNKVYSLTTKGKLLALSLLKPNGMEEPEIRQLLNKVLEIEFNLDDQEYRNDIIETFRTIGKDISWQKHKA